MYKNPKVELVLTAILNDGIKMSEQDFADLAIACADQAGMSVRDQSLFEQLLTATVENLKHRRSQS